MHPVRLAVEQGRKVARAKRGRADVAPAYYLGAIPIDDPDRVRPSGRAQLETFARRVLEDGVGGRDAQAVAALLGLRAIRLEDPDGHRLRVEGQQTIGAAAPVALAQCGPDLDHPV